MEPAWQCQQCGGTKKRNGFQEHQDEGPQNRWQHQWQCDGQGRAQAAGAEDVRCVLHFRGDEIERGLGEHEYVGKTVAGDDKNQPGHGVDIERSLFHAGHFDHQLVQPPGIGTGQQNPTHSPQIRRNDEGAQDGDPDQAFGGHVGAGQRPRQRYAEDDAQARSGNAQDERIQQRFDIPRAAVGDKVVGQGKGPIRLLEADHQQAQQGIDDQEQQQADGQQPHPGRLVQMPPPLTERRRTGR